jgi:DNA-binding transcriptional ArsR family regulator
LTTRRLGERIRDVSPTQPALPRDLTFRALRDTVCAAVATGWEPELERTLHAISRHIHRLKTDKDYAGAVRAASAIDRLAESFRGDSDPLAVFARGYLQALLVELEQLVSGLAQYHDVLERCGEAAGVREQVLRVIVSQPQIRPSEIGEQLDLTPPAVARALRELRESGYITVEQHPHDRRGRVCWPVQPAA